MHHFFTDTEFFGDGQAVITGPDVNHIKNVLRMRPGERILLSDGKGTNCLCELVSIEPDRVTAKILPQEVEDGGYGAAGFDYRLSGASQRR